VIVYPNCKINLGLNILRKRVDGYHDLETFFYPIPFTDILEVIENKAHETITEISFTSSGINIPGLPESNLCVKAWKVLKVDFPEIPGAIIHLHKIIPIGAGLGGGSADGAFALQLYNQLFQLELSYKQLLHYAAQLGSDCSFFIINKPCFASGRGEELKEVSIDLSAYKMLLVNPGISINTTEAFSKLKPAIPEKPLAAIISEPIAYWKEQLFNDFEQPVFGLFPEIKMIKESLYKAGAVYASMSGSGSSVYGIFPKDMPLKYSFPPHYFIKEMKLNS
jgi:4-diphosphocytidyl-2-C-methyl-D-erythritol kinase